MRLTLLDENKVSDILLNSVGINPNDVAGVADLLREEVSARCCCPRYKAIARVSKFIAPIVTINAETISNVCELLERSGDLLLGFGGNLFPTPVRAITLGGGTFRLVSSLSTKRLTALLVGEWEIDGITRTCHLESERKDLFMEEIKAVGGVVLSLSTWAGFDRTPPADSQWLSSLERRLQLEAEPAGSLERDEQLVWNGCVAIDDNIRWKSDDTGKMAQLWHTRNRWGYWLYAWTQGGSPTFSPFITLRPDEGLRSYFAVARSLGVPLEATLEQQAERTIITLDSWLPVAEYRYLSISASLVQSKKKGKQWLIPNDRISRVLDVLQERLGLIIRKEADL
ncbi:MAG: hypothetical protein AB1489_15545 [Acidobacteriota bacterium]